MTQLQAKDRDGKSRQYPVYMDGLTKADVDWIIKFAQETLNVNPSFAVVLRAALSHYRSYLMAEPAFIKDLDKLTEFIQNNRDLMFFAAGRPERASDERYMTIE